MNWDAEDAATLARTMRRLGWHLVEMAGPVRWAAVAPGGRLVYGRRAWEVLEAVRECGK
jgi:hypothetical protein